MNYASPTPREDQSAPAMDDVHLQGGTRVSDDAGLADSPAIDRFATGSSIDHALAYDLGHAIAGHRLELSALSARELTALEEDVAECLSPVFDEFFERWLKEHGKLSERDWISRELRRRILSERDTLRDFFECAGCDHRDREDHLFINFHGLLLCEGCIYDARDTLRELRRPLIEVLEAEPTLGHARALGFELVRRDDHRLFWTDGDDVYDGGDRPYADEQDALEDLVEELT